MAMKDEIKACLIASLEVVLDPYMSEQGFTRGKRSLVYKRQLKGATQSIDLAIEIHPKDTPNSAAAVYPRMEVFVPSVNKVLQDMIGDNLSLPEGFTGGPLRQPIAFTSEKAHTGRWYVYQPDSVPGIIEDMRTFLERWTLPLLEAYATPEDIIATYERNDGRLVNDRAQLMRVVAAALFCNRADFAVAVMENRLGATGPRRIYRQVYDYISQFC